MALPVQFSLRPCEARRRDAPLAPCLSVRYPLPERPWKTVEVVRLLDPEHREPLLSLARICAVANPPVSPQIALLRFLSSASLLEDPKSLAANVTASYSIFLGGLAPFADFWVPLRLASQVAELLGVARPLANLLAWDTRLAWSCIEWAPGAVADKLLRSGHRTGELVSNWQIPSSNLPSHLYSVQALCSTPFEKVDILQDSTSLRLPFSLDLSKLDAFAPQPGCSAEADLYYALSGLCNMSSETPAELTGDDPDHDAVEDLAHHLMQLLEAMAHIVDPAQAQRSSAPKDTTVVVDVGTLLLALQSSPPPRNPTPPVRSAPSARKTPPPKEPVPLMPISRVVEDQLESIQTNTDAILLHLREARLHQAPASPHRALRWPPATIVGVFVAGVAIGLAMSAA